MNTPEMHTMFRVLAQKQGAQLTRNILPESIDVYLNSVIVEKVRTELLRGTQEPVETRYGFSSRTIGDSSVMNPINTFRTLFKNARYSINVDEYSSKKLPNTELEQADSKLFYYNKDNGYFVINIPSTGSEIAIDESKENYIDYMMILGVSIEYDNKSRGSAKVCRIIGADLIEETINDYCNKASKEYPIAVLKSNDNILKNYPAQLDIYTDTKDAKIMHINIKYLKTPNVVKFDNDLSKCVNCDLPEFLHREIVENAVVKFLTASNFNQLNKQTNQ